MVKHRRALIAAIQRRLLAFRDGRHTLLSDHGIRLLEAEQLALHRECETLAELKFLNPNGDKNVR